MKIKFDKAKYCAECGAEIFGEKDVYCKECQKELGIPYGGKPKKKNNKGERRRNYE